MSICSSYEVSGKKDGKPGEYYQAPGYIILIVGPSQSSFSTVSSAFVENGCGFPTVASRFLEVDPEAALRRRIGSTLTRKYTESFCSISVVLVGRHYLLVMSLES